MDKAREFLGWVGAIGDRPEDTERERLWHRLLVYLGLLMSCGGIVWGSLAAWYELGITAIIPYSYTAVTAVNFLYFSLSKNFRVVRFIQVLASLLLPFMFQWSLGGFVSSGTVMIWSMVAIVGSMTFSEVRWTVFWLMLYSLLTVFSGVIDGDVQEHFTHANSVQVHTLLSVLNIVVVSNVVFGLAIYLLYQRERANVALEEANTQFRVLNVQFEDEVARFRAILTNMADGLVAVDIDGRIQALNPALCQILSISPQATEQLASETLPGRLPALVAQSLDTVQPIKADLQLPGQRTASAVASPITTIGEGGAERCVGSVIIVRDVTLETEVDRMKTEFTATVSHELRTPLTSVLGFAKLTRNKLESSIFRHVPEDDRKAQKALGQVRGNIDIILSEGNRLTSLVNDVLDISKMEAGRMEWKRDAIAPSALVERAMEATTSLFPESGEVLVRREIEPDLPDFEGDFDRLLQVVINLISNAVKFTAQGEVVVRARRVAGGVELSVSDTGEGIAPEDLASIFEKFKQVGDTLTNKPQGTGLGLPICRHIVTAHGGTIDVESQPGEGSRFYFVLPTDALSEETRP